MKKISIIYLAAMRHRPNTIKLNGYEFYKNQKGNYISSSNYERLEKYINFEDYDKPLIEISDEDYYYNTNFIKVNVKKEKMFLFQEHIVSKGETLWGIATNNSSSISEIMRTNNIQNMNIINVGDIIIVPRHINIKIIPCIFCGDDIIIKKENFEKDKHFICDFCLSRLNSDIIIKNNYNFYKNFSFVHYHCIKCDKSYQDYKSSLECCNQYAKGNINEEE